MKTVKEYGRKPFIIGLILLLNLLAFPFGVKAESVSAISDTMTRQAKDEDAIHTIEFTTPTGVAAGETITVTFPAGFDISTLVYTDMQLEDDGTPLTLGSTPSGTTWGAQVAGQVVTFTSGTGTIGATSVVTIVLGGATHKVGNPGTANTYIVNIGGTMDDSGSFAVVIVDNDQVSVTASVAPSITFSLSANSTAFGQLSTGSVSTSTGDITLTVGTNGVNGYTITIQDEGTGTNAGLFNSGTSTYIASASALLSAGTEGYGINASSASATIAAPYNVSGNNVGALQRTAQNLATYNTATSSNHSITVKHLAAISASTKAGSYVDTLTYIATGNF